MLVKKMLKVAGLVVWWIVFIGFAIVLLRLLTEMTYWTWLRGPQNVGFSLLHSEWALLAICAYAAGAVLAVGTALILLIDIVRRIRRKRAYYIRSIIILSAVGLSLVPYSFWMWLVVKCPGPVRDQHNSLTYASALGYERVVEALLDDGVDIDSSSDGQYGSPTALFAAATAGQADMALRLLELGATVDWQHPKTGETPLMRAASQGHKDVVEVLLASGADPSLQDAMKRTAHGLALTDSIALLLESYLTQSGLDTVFAD